MNHVKCIFNTNVPRRVSSNTGVTQRNNCRNEGPLKKRFTRPRTPKVDNSFLLAVKKLYPVLIQRHLEDTRLADNRREMLRGTQGGKSTSIANSLRRLLSERKLSVQCFEGINSKQAVRFGSSSSLSYDRTINYDDDKDSRSYAQMITAYNETVMTVDKASSIFQDRSNSKLNARLSKTLFKSTSTLTSSAYNFENLTIKENTEETSFTDSSYAINTIIDNNNDIHEEKTKDLDEYSSAVVPKTDVRSYANIIADYSASMDVDSIMNKYRKDFPKMSNVSLSSKKASSLDTSRIEKNVSEFTSSPDLSTDSCKKVKTKEELEWVRKVDKIINDLKAATAKTSPKVNEKTSGLKENDVLECVTEQAIWVDKSKNLTNKKKSDGVSPRNEVNSNDPMDETKNYKARIEMTDKTSGLQASQNKPSSSNLDASTRKDWSKIPRSTETSISVDPQVELRMVPSGNESIVSVNVEAIAKAMESRNPDFKELSVVVSSPNKQETMKHSTARNNAREESSNFGSMRISISEESLPVKELELSINGKPISDVRSIKARTETLNVMTSVDKVEIRVPYLQDNPSKRSQNTKNFVRNVRSTESVLKLKIATAFDGTYPILTTDVTKNMQAQANVQPSAPKARYAHTEGGNVTPKSSETSPTIKSPSIQELSIKKAEKLDDKSSKQTIQYNMSQDRPQETTWTKLKNKYVEKSTISGGDITKTLRSGDIDLRLTKTFGRSPRMQNIDDKINVESTIEVKKDNPELKSISNVKKVETSKDVKSASEKENTKTLKDIIVKHSGWSTDGNSSPVSSKPKLGSNQNREGSKPSGNKRDSKAMDEGKKQSTLNNPSSKPDMFDQRVSSKWSPWWSSSDTYVKLKKEEDYHKNYSIPTNVTEKQKAKEFDSMDKVPPKTTKESSRASEEEKTLSAKSQDPSKSMERKQETKETMSASSKVRDADRTLKSSFKSENIQVTRHDSPHVNEKIKRHSFSSRTQIAEEKLNKRNEGPSKKETRNVTMSNEMENRKDIDTKNEIKGKINVTLKSANIKNEAQQDMVNAKSKDRLAKDDEKTRNETFIFQKMSSKDEFPDINFNLQQNIRKKERPTKSASALSDEDLRLKEILNYMKPIEKMKDGTLIDYGIKVASRKKLEKLKERPKSNVERSNFAKKIEALHSLNNIKTNYSVQLHANKQNPLEYSPRSFEFKKEDKVEKETVSAKDTDVDEDKSPANLNENKEESSQFTDLKKLTLDKDSLRERITKVLQKAKNQVPNQDVIEVSSNVDNVKEMKKSSEKSKEIYLEAIISEKVAAEDILLDEQISKTVQKLENRIPYHNIKDKYMKFHFKKEEPVNAKKAEQKSEEDIREPFEGTVVPKPSKSSPGSILSDTGATEPFAGTIVRPSPKETEKRKPKTISYKHTSNTMKSSVNAMEKPSNPPILHILATKTNKNEGDSSGSQNNFGTPSTPGSPNDSSTPKMSKSYSISQKAIDLQKSNEFEKLRCQNKIKQMEVKSVDELKKPRRPEKEMVYSIWLQRSKEKIDNKKP